MKHCSRLYLEDIIVNKKNNHKELYASTNHVSGEMDPEAFPDHRTIWGLCMEQCRRAKELMFPEAIFSQ